MTDIPAPLTPADCDLRDFGFMPIEPGRLFGSEFHALADDAAWRAGVTLWLKAWHQVPAGSLPADDTALTRLAELGRDRDAWAAVRAAALRGWIECSDGRLYHPVVAEKALEAWIEKLLQRSSSAAGNAKRWGAEADTAGNDARIERAAALLFVLAPQSRCLPKLARRQVRRATQPRSGKTPHPGGGSRQSRRTHTGSPDAVPVGSQGTVKGQGQGLTPFPRNADALSAVMKAGGMIRHPTDQHLLREWLALPDMQLERDILPIVARVGAEVLERTAKAPFKLKLFDAAIREQHAADQAEMARLRRVRERAERMDREQAA